MVSKNFINFSIFLVLFIASVMVLIIPVSADVIENGDFYYDYSGWTSSGTVTSGEDTHSATWYELNANTHDGYVAFSVGSGGKTEHTVTHQLIQNINVTDIDTIYIRGKGTGISGAGRTFTLYVGSLSYGLSANTSWDVYALNVSTLSGVQEIKIKLYLYSDYDRYGASYDIDWVRTNTYYEYVDTDAVSWDKDPYYTGETATIETRCYDFNDTTYSYYLDLYNTQEYLTTYEITSETESNYYTFPTEWTDTSLLAKLMRVTDPYGTNEVQLAYDISHFETLEWDTTISFDKSSYDPGETLTVAWSGVPTGSTIWLRAGDDGEKLEVNAAYSGSFQFTVPANTEETYYLADVITSGSSQAQASCVINIGDYWTTDSIYIDSYTVNKTTFEGQTTAVAKDESAKATLTTNINVDFVDVYYYNEEMGVTITQDFIQDINDNVVNITFSNSENGYYYARIDVFNISTSSDNRQYLFFDVGTGSRAIDIYNTKVVMMDTGESITTESIAGYGGNDLYLPLARTIMFDLYTDEIINSTLITEDGLDEGGANYNFTQDYHLRRSYLFTVPGLHVIEMTVYNDETSSNDYIKWNAYVQGIDQSELNGSVVMYWTKSEIEINDKALLYFNVSDMPSTPTLTITSTTESNYGTERTLNINQVGTETVPTDEEGVYTAIITNAEGVVYAISTLTIIDSTEEEEEIADEVLDTIEMVITFLSMPAFWGMVIWVGVVGGAAQKVSGNSTGYIAFLFANILAVIGLFAPYTIYIVLITWIAAGIFFKLGRDATGGE